MKLSYQLPPPDIDPTQLGRLERLEKYPDSYTDEELEQIIRMSESATMKGPNARIPPLAFLILEERKNRSDYTKGKRKK